MKIERINDNQIRCTLTSFDLSARNINLMELAYGTEKARKLFREMIQKASNDVGFEAEDIPLMVEVIPLPGESIMLVITKIEDPEELDTRFSKFSPYGEDTAGAVASQLASEFLEGAQASLEYLGSSIPKEIAEEAAGSTDGSAENAASEVCRIFRFDSLDRAAEASRAVSGIWTGSSTLYKKPESRQYYLVLRHAGSADLAFSRICNILAEYAVKIQGEHASEAYFKEHYEVLIPDHALENLIKV